MTLGPCIPLGTGSAITGVPPSIAKRSAIFFPPEIFVHRLEVYLDTCEYGDTLADAGLFVNWDFGLAVGD